MNQQTNLIEHTLLQSPEIAAYDGSYTGPKRVLLKECEQPLFPNQRYVVCIYSVKTDMEYQRIYCGCRWEAAWKFECRCVRLGCVIRVAPTPHGDFFIEGREKERESNVHLR